MNRDDAHKLLGGYATGTLTPEEQQALFAAALEDQELFDALAREQSLRDLLRDPAAKAQVLRALDAKPTAWYRRGWWRPASVAVAMAGIAAMVVVVTRKPVPAPPAAMVAKVESHAPPQFDSRAAEPAKTSPVEMDKASPVTRREPAPIPELRKATEGRDQQPAGSPPAPPPPSAPKDLPAATAPATAPPLPPEPSNTLAPSRKEVASQTGNAFQFATGPSAGNSQVQVAGQVAGQIPVAPMVAQQSQQLGFRDAPGGSGGALDRLSAVNARLLFYGSPGSTGAISGRVTDATNAGIVGAKIAVVQAGTETKFEATTDRDGMYTIPFLPQAIYRISADAPGFKRYARDNVAAGANVPQRIDIPMEIGALTETVEVTSAPLRQGITASTGLQSAKKAAPAARVANTLQAAAKFAAVPALHMGVRCSILRKQPNGEFVEAGIATVLAAGEQVTLKLIPNTRGYLRVLERSPAGEWRTLASGPAEPQQAFEAQLAGSASPGARQIYVQFTHDRDASLTAAAFGSLQNQTQANLVQNVADAEKATYVVNPAVVNPAAVSPAAGAASQQLVVPITLTYR